jgi:hypothetical protein
MGESQSVLAFSIIISCVLVGIFITKIKTNDVLSWTERRVLGFFRGFMLWIAVGAYAISITSFVVALAMRLGLAKDETLLVLLGQSIAAQIEAWGLLTISMMSFLTASTATILLVLIAFELHLRRIAKQSERTGFFDT